MRNLSSFIASTAQHGERQPVGAWAAGAFVAILIAGAAGAAFWIGNAMTGPAAAAGAPVYVVADEGY